MLSFLRRRIGITRSDRVRGSGWLDCTNCHEHAAQDVVDEMRFVSFFYRFTPVWRSRYLICRRCGFRRAASADEMRRLETSGRPIRRAWLVPVGLSPFAFAGLVTLIFATATGSKENTGLTFLKTTLAPVSTIELEAPSGWNSNPDPDTDPPAFSISDPSQRTELVFKRLARGGNLQDTLAAHWTDATGLSTTNFPDQPCPIVNGTIAGSPAVSSSAKYLERGDPAKMEIFVVQHQSVDYVIIYTALGDTAVGTLDDLVRTINDSIKFGAEATPSPGTETSTPSASASASPSPSASGSAEASPSATSSAASSGCG